MVKVKGQLMKSLKQQIETLKTTPTPPLTALKQVDWERRFRLVDAKCLSLERGLWEWLKGWMVLEWEKNEISHQVDFLTSFTHQSAGGISYGDGVGTTSLVRIFCKCLQLTRGFLTSGTALG